MTVGPYCVSAPSLCSVVYRRTVDVLERWLSELCWPMQYSSTRPQLKVRLREGLKDARARAFPGHSLNLRYRS